MTDKLHPVSAECEIDGRAAHPCETLLAAKRKLTTLPTGRVTIILSSEKGRDDMLRFARDAGYGAQPLGRRDDDFLLRLERGKPEEREQLERVALAERPKDKLLLISSESIGAPDKSLGRMLMKKFLYSLTETEQRPTAIVIVSSGVRLASSDSESLEVLHALEGAGVDVMVCRASAEFLNLKDKIAVGRLCDMYQIVERLLAASNTLTI